MTDITPHDRHSDLDGLLRDALPEIKLALGELIDKENARTLPTKYARLLPETLLVVTLRPDAAEALAPVATAVERELTDSCTRHGSLYDRAYRVQLRRSEDPEASLYRVAAFAGSAPDEPAPAPAAAPAGPPVTGTGPAVGSATFRPEPHVDLPAVQADRGPAPSLPVSDPDATRIAAAGIPGWQGGRWLLLVENDAGEQQEVFRLTDSFVTVGRKSNDPQLRTTVALSDAPHVSRRQLALVWEERDGAPGFKVYNLGLNPVHLPSQEIPGAHVGRGALRLDSIPDKNAGWLPPGVPLRIGDQGPTLRLEEVPASEGDEGGEAPAEPGKPPVDPDATVFE